MPFLTRQRSSRAVFPALLATIALATLISGCGEDRSNLIPSDTAESLIAKFDEVKTLAAAGNCFEAAPVAAEAQQEIESMSADVDPRLKRSLLDGVTELTVMVNDPEKCIESGTTTTDEPTGTEEEKKEPEGTTGVTGTTETGETTTGDQGPATDDDQDSRQPQNNGNGNQRPRPTNPPDTTPTNPPNTGNPNGPGSGGLGPG